MITFRQIVAALQDVPVDHLPEVYEYLLSLRYPTPHSPNALTLQVLEDTDAGRNLQTGESIDEFFARVHAPE